MLLLTPVGLTPVTLTVYVAPAESAGITTFTTCTKSSPTSVPDEFNVVAADVNVFVVKS